MVYLYRFAAVQLSSEIPFDAFEPFGTDGLSSALPVIELVSSRAAFDIPQDTECCSHEQIDVYTFPDHWIYVDKAGNQLRVSRDYLRLSFYRSGLFIAGIPQNFLLRPVIECLSIRQGVPSLHSACVETGNAALCFTGKSGLGKSTRANAMAEALGTALISGDRPQIMLKDGKMIACGVPWDGKEQIFRNVQLPLAAVLEVRRSESVHLRYLSAAQKTALLMHQCFIPMWDSETAALAILAVRRLAKQMNIIRCFCGPDIDAARAVYDIIVNHPESIGQEEKDMKIKPGFVLRNIVDEYVVMPAGENVGKYNGTVILNELSAFIYGKLEQGIAYDDLLTAILDEYDVSADVAKSDLDELLEKFRGFGLLDE